MGTRPLTFTRVCVYLGDKPKSSDTFSFALDLHGHKINMHQLCLCFNRCVGVRDIWKCLACYQQLDDCYLKAKSDLNVRSERGEKSNQFLIRVGPRPCNIPPPVLLCGAEGIFSCLKRVTLHSAVHARPNLQSPELQVSHDKAN